MFYFPPTLILRHRRENLKKCSLRGLENRDDCLFLTYPTAELPNLSNYCILSMEGPPLSSADRERGIFIIDGTWRHAKTMEKTLPPQGFRRSLPSTIMTAYPRRQDDCPDPKRGLASIEALYIAYLILGRDVAGLLDHYYWKEPFQENLLKISSLK